MVIFKSPGMVSDGNISNTRVNNFSLFPLLFSCLQLNSRQFFPQSLPKPNTLGQQRRTKKNQRKISSHSNYPFGSLSAPTQTPNFFQHYQPKTFLESSANGTTWIFCTKTTHVTGYKSLHRSKEPGVTWDLPA